MVFHMVAWVRMRYPSYFLPLTPGLLLQAGQAGSGILRVGELILALTGCSIPESGPCT